MVTVIIDNYNYGKYVGEAIDSVLAQTYDDYEIIVVDDGSTDNSKEIIEKYVYANPDKIRAIFKENGGQASAFNRGFEEANGEILAFLDSDDVWNPDKLERIVPFFENYDVVGHNAIYTNGAKNVQSIYMEDRRDYLLKEYGFSYTYRLATSQICMSKRAFEKAYPIPEKRWRICADHYMLYVASYYFNIKYIDEKISTYRIHDNNAFAGRKVNDDYKYEKMDHDSALVLNARLAEEGKKLIPEFTTKQMMRMLKDFSDGFSIEVGGEYVIYGASGLGKEAAGMWRKLGADIVYYCDSDPQKWGKTFDGREIISPKDLILLRDKYDKIIIGSHYFSEISLTLNKLGLVKGKDYMYTEFIHLRPYSLLVNRLV